MNVPECLVMAGTVVLVIVAAVMAVRSHRELARTERELNRDSRGTK